MLNWIQRFVGKVRRAPKESPHEYLNPVPETESGSDEEPDSRSYSSSSSVRYTGIYFKPDPDSGYGTEYGAASDSASDFSSDNSPDSDSGDWSGTSQGGIGW